MGWSRNKTLSILILILILMFAFAFLAIALIVYHLRLKKEENNQFLISFTYLAATTFGTGLGCIWFRICQTKRTWSHAIIHSVSLGCMLFSHQEIFQLLIDGEIAECYNMYPISMLTLCIYIMQFILTFLFVIFRCGKTPHQRTFTSALHAFIGAIILFVSITDGLLVCHKISIDEHLENKITFHMAAICLFFYGVAIWYIILNPYFDWRRIRTQPSKSADTIEQKIQFHNKMDNRRYSIANSSILFSFLFFLLK